ncbi:MAG: hypothetical protein QN187_02100 [Armatimonadota bacterium]|nr:hypothetical protein [Armatimonadota bacterium]MDR7519339.1 hypothetical protein [Armatimonadota bacterium]MDR7550810.1 hypothetical protein [Armatimonadota bacterium]
MNQTIRWGEPLGHDRTSVGLLLLPVNLVGAIPVLGVSLECWKYGGRQAEKARLRQTG